MKLILSTESNMNAHSSSSRLRESQFMLQAANLWDSRNFGDEGVCAEHSAKATTMS